MIMLWCEWEPDEREEEAHGSSHLYYTIPPGIALTLLYRPLFTALDAYRILCLITASTRTRNSGAAANKTQIAVVATIPWDSYLIRNNVWSYPRDAVLGPAWFSIPAEELFFFGIQTYNTSLLYLMVTKPVFHPILLKREGAGLAVKRIGGGTILAAIAVGWSFVVERGTGFYMGLILVWAGPFVLLLW